MTYFVRTYKAYQLSHQFLIKLGGTCFGVYIGCLNHVPVVYEGHDVVVPSDMALDNLSASGVMNIRTVSIGNVRGQIANHREA